MFECDFKCLSKEGANTLLPPLISLPHGVEGWMNGRVKIDFANLEIISVQQFCRPGGYFAFLSIFINQSINQIIYNYIQIDLLEFSTDKM